MRNRMIIGLVALGVGLSVGCGGGGGGGGGGTSCTAASATATTAVSAMDYSFNPSCVKVNAGQAIIWTNIGAAPHTVTSDAGAPASFDSGTLNPGGTFSHTFTMTGTYNYHCAFHVSMGMTGTVIVQ